MDVLCGKGGVVHEEKVNIGDCSALATSQCAQSKTYRTIADEESLVAAGHHVACLLV
jgi:hypothetical protein